MVINVLALLALAAAGLQLVAAQYPESCIASSCKTYRDINTLWCHSDPSHFCQCRPDPSGAWVEQVMPCARNGTRFSFRRQTCVLVDQWNQNECLEMESSAIEKDKLIYPACNNPCTTYEEIKRLWCHSSERKMFCQCRPTAVELVFQPVEMPCAGGTSFNFQRQACTHDALWTDSCPV